MGRSQYVRTATCCDLLFGAQAQHQGDVHDCSALERRWGATATAAAVHRLELLVRVAMASLDNSCLLHSRMTACISKMPDPELGCCSI